MKSIQELLSAVENHAAAARVSTATTSDIQTPAATAAPPSGGPASDPRQAQSVVIGTLLVDQPQATGTNGDQPAAGNNGKAVHGEQSAADDDQAERLLKELETVVTEVRAGKSVQSDTLSQLEARFDELKLCGHETEARLLRLIQQLLEAPDDRPPAEPGSPPAANGHTPAVTLPDDQID
jgi:hypothetical protein